MTDKDIFQWKSQGYNKPWLMLYDRLVNFHGLNNLIWVYNTNEYKPGVNPHATHYPGDDVVDIIATDVYSEGFNQENYDMILELAGNKPIALGEVGTPPSLKILKNQPRWTWFMRWGDRSWGENPPDFRELLNSEQVISLDELPWVGVEEPRLHYPYLK